MLNFDELDDTRVTTSVGQGNLQRSYERSAYLDFAWSLLLEVEQNKGQSRLPRQEACIAKRPRLVSGALSFLHNQSVLF